jgi:hypothetical protein
MQGRSTVAVAQLNDPNTDDEFNVRSPHVELARNATAFRCVHMRRHRGAQMSTPDLPTPVSDEPDHGAAAVVIGRVTGLPVTGPGYAALTAEPDPSGARTRKRIRAGARCRAVHQVPGTARVTAADTLWPADAVIRGGVLRATAPDRPSPAPGRGPDTGAVVGARRAWARLDRTERRPGRLSPHAARGCPRARPHSCGSCGRPSVHREIRAVTPTA